MAKRILRDWHGRYVKGTAKVFGSGRKSGNQHTPPFLAIPPEVIADAFKTGYVGDAADVKLYQGRGMLRRIFTPRATGTVTVKDNLSPEQLAFRRGLEKTFQECLDISKKKNADYASSTDPFKNFRACEILGVPLTKGIIVRMSDKMTRIANLLERKAEVSDESIEDTLHDLINYAAILNVYIKYHK